MKTLVVATDGSDLAIHAGERALAILQPSDRLLFVSVSAGPDPSLLDDATGHAGASLTPDEFNRQNEAAKAEGETAVEATISALRDRGPLPERVETMVVDGQPGPALCKFAEEVGAEAIVVGSRGRSGIKRAFLGSVSDYVVRNAPCSVVVTR
jgi:nucleotide-binding universal stress UspA family protein